MCLIVQYLVLKMMTRRIAFVSTGFTGSILPLANELLKRGLCVDLYLLVFKSQNQHEHEALEIRGNKQYKYGISSIPNQSLRGIDWMYSADKFKFHLICNVGNAQNHNRIIKTVANFAQKLLIRRAIAKICIGHYDFINVVGHDNFSTLFSILLQKKKLCVVHTFHEVCLHSEPHQPLLDTVIRVISHNVPIIVPSEYLKHKIKQKYSSCNVEVVKFGKFIGFQNFGGNVLKEISKSNYLLFLGNILPYKGLHILYDAYQLLKERGITIKIVIAGNGKSSLLEEINKNQDFTVINRWVTNDEVASLTKGCVAVVCPYLSASQSGLPVTAYTFDKPVIVTDVGAMKEYVEDSLTGNIIPPNNSTALAECIGNIISCPSDKFSPSMIKQGIANLNLDWDKICTNYLKIIEK